MESCKRLDDITFLAGVLSLLFQSGYGLMVVRTRIDNALDPEMEADFKANAGKGAASDTIGSDEYWPFSIKPNSQRMRYKCRFKWAGELHYLTIYDQWRGIELGTYHWSVNEDDGCLLMDSIGTWQCYSWKQSA